MDSIPVKRCTHCNREFPAASDYFHQSRSKHGGLHSWCKTCRSIAQTKPQATPIQLLLALDRDSIEIPLTRGCVTIVDIADADLANHKWIAAKSRTDTFYARRTIHVDKKPLCLHLHRVIFERVLGRPLLDSERVDHKDRNPLNNRRSNLRLATHAENIRNSRKHIDNRSGYRGVSWYTNYQKWKATIRVNGRPMHLGYFDNPEDAHEAYRKAAKEHYGEFANLD